MDKLKEILGKIRSFLGGLALWQKLSLLGAGALVLGALFLVVFWAGRTTYEPLFAGLDVEDQASIVTILKDEKIPYRLDPAANAILVPRETVYETRLALAKDGLPRGGNVGYELFDDSKMGMSDFQQKIAYLRALEGELSRTVQEIDAVEYAKVNIVIPEQRLFLEQQQPSTASVLVRLTPGKTVGPEQVKSIVHLVARSVEGLTMDNVTVVDTSGTVLSDMIGDENFIYGAGADGRGVSSVQRELERQQEAEFERKVRIMLERVFGPGKAVVRVRVELDFDKRRSSVKEYIPAETGKGIVRSQQNMEELYEGPGGYPGAPPGTTTNIPGYVVPPGGQGDSEYSKTETVTNYDITTREEEQVDTPGGVRRVSASVLVDAELEGLELEGLRDAVSAAIGLNPARGDKLVIHPIRFSTTFMDAMLAQLQAERRQQLIVILVISALALLAAVLAAIWWLRRRRRLQALAGSQEAPLPSLQDLMENPELLGENEIVVLEEQLKAYAMRHPEEVALLINNWLDEE